MVAAIASDRSSTFKTWHRTTKMGRKNGTSGFFLLLEISPAVFHPSHGQQELQCRLERQALPGVRLTDVPNRARV
jgi:hypothetical protein